MTPADLFTLTPPAPAPAPRPAVLPPAPPAHVPARPKLAGDKPRDFGDVRDRAAMSLERWARDLRRGRADPFALPATLRAAADEIERLYRSDDE